MSSMEQVGPPNIEGNGGGEKTPNRNVRLEGVGDQDIIEIAEDVAGGKIENLQVKHDIAFRSEGNAGVATILGQLYRDYPDSYEEIANKLGKNSGEILDRYSECGENTDDLIAKYIPEDKEKPKEAKPEKNTEITESMRTKAKELLLMDAQKLQEKDENNEYRLFRIKYESKDLMTVIIMYRNDILSKSKYDRPKGAEGFIPIMLHKGTRRYTNIEYDNGKKFFINPDTLETFQGIDPATGKEEILMRDNTKLEERPDITKEIIATIAQ